MGCSDDHGPGYLGRAASRGLDEERAVLRKLKCNAAMGGKGKEAY